MIIQLRHLILKHLLILPIMLASSMSFAQSDMGQATAGVNFRSGPGKKYRVLTGVGKGDYFSIISRSGNWTKVELADGKQGYIYSKYVKQKTEAQATNEPEGGIVDDCIDCKKGRLPQIQVPSLQAVLSKSGAGGACVTRKLMETAPSVARNKTYWKYLRKDKRPRSKAALRHFIGWCGVAVRAGLSETGIWQGGAFGHARDFVPNLEKMGFVNLLKKNKNITPESAPDGAILVYGPQKRGYKCSGQGKTYGHVELKKSDREYVYDGVANRDIQKKFGKNCRPLIGVMQMGNSCPTCTPELKRSCGV